MARQPKLGPPAEACTPLRAARSGRAFEAHKTQQRPAFNPTAVPRETRSRRAASIQGSRWQGYFDIFFFFDFFVAMAHFLLV